MRRFCLLALVVTLLLPAVQLSAQQPRSIAGLEAVDGTNKIVGPVCADYNGPYAMVCLQSGDVLFRLPVDRSGFLAQSETYFASPDCAPPAVIPAGSQIYPTANVIGSSVFVENRTVAPQSAAVNSKRDLAGNCVVVPTTTMNNARPAVELTGFNTFSGPFWVRGAGDTAAMVSVSVSAPAGLAVSVDGVSHTGSRTFSWFQGSQHTISTGSPQAGTAGTRYLFAGWSDGGAMTHIITASNASTAFTANFTTQHQLMISASPAAGGTVTPGSGDFYNAGSVVNIAATANTGYRFLNWTGTAASPSSASTTITLNAPVSVDAKFQLSTVVTWTTAPPTNATYNSAFTVAAATNSGGSISYTVSGGCTINGATITMTSGTESCVVTASDPGNADYPAASINGTTTAVKAAASINVTGFSGAYDTNAHGASGTAMGVNGEDLNALLNLGATFTDVPGGVSSWTFPGSANYESANGTATVAISKVAANVTVTPYKLIFDGKPHTATGTATGAGGANLSAALNLSGTTHTDAGTYTDSWTFSGGTNYKDADGTVHDEIVPPTVVTWMTALPASAVYNSTFTVAAATNSGGSVRYAVAGACTINEATVTMTSGTGACVVSASDPGNANYASASINGTTTALKAVANIKVTGFNGAYDAKAHGASGAAAGVNGEDLSALMNLGATFTNSPGGMASWTFSGNANYKSAAGTAVISITPQSLMVAAANVTRPYGTPNPALTATIIGFVNGENASVVSGAAALSTMASQFSLPGSYPISISKGSLSAANYTFVLAGGTLTVTPTGTAPSSGNACDGAYNGTFSGNLSVSTGQTCVFYGGGSVSGNVQVNGGNVMITGGNIGGNVILKNGTSSLRITSANIGGNVHIEGLESNSGPGAVCGSTIEGNFIFQGNGAPMQIGNGAADCPANTIKGNVIIESNSSTIGVIGNTITGQLQIQANTGAVTVFDNKIDKNLQCQNNSSILGGGNTAKAQQGQCLAF